MFGGYSKSSVKNGVRKLDGEYKKMFEEECQKHKEELSKLDDEISSLRNNTNNKESINKVEKPKEETANTGENNTPEPKESINASEVNFL